MSSFFKYFLAALLALVVFIVIAFFIGMSMLAGLASPPKETIPSKSVLVVDMSQPFGEIGVENPLAGFGDGDKYDLPSVYDVVRMIEHARGDSAIKGIYVKCNGNANGFGTNEDIRNAILAFKSSGKFVIAYGEVMSQGAYYVANAASRIYCNPQGGLDWNGYAMRLFFMKGTLEKLEIEPQIFYAGKFKSATEPFRENKMTDANRLQTSEILHDLYGHFLLQTSAARNIDTAQLHRFANENLIRFASDALKYGLVDGLKYDDEVKDEIKTKLGIGKYDKVSFVPIGKYAKAVDFRKRGQDRIAVIYAQGNIIDGKSDHESIGSETYVNLVRRMRLDKNIKAVVLRINSGGGSALASENIWRELTLTRKEKPVVISFGDVSASGGYYLSCNADSIFAQPNTITGSIGVFSIVPNMQKFFNNKLGVTFDGVSTSPESGALSVTKPLTETQKRYFQEGVDSIYHTFLSRVAEGRQKSYSYIDSIAQGRIWSGKRAKELGLIDHIGGMQDAVDCAARMAKTTSYRLREYPEPQNLFDLLFGGYQQNGSKKAIEKELGAEGVKTYKALKYVKQMVGIAQARLPFDFEIE